MSEVKHTPLPWKVAGETGDGKAAVFAAFHAGPMIAAFYRVEDAAMAVQAVNSHGDLVEALRKAIYLIRDAEKDTNWSSAPWDEPSVADEFEALLSKVLELGEGL